VPTSFSYRVWSAGYTSALPVRTVGGNRMTDDDGRLEDLPQRAWHIKQLKWSLQAVAQAGTPQPSLFPEQVPGPDDLAFGFDHWSSLVRDLYAADLSTAQVAALDAIAEKLTTMSRDGSEFDVELWTETAMRTSEHWAQLRGQALAALEAFGWNVEVPE
jgi:hypothetical protein